VAYSAALIASGGEGRYNWSVTSGSLPAGLTLGTGGTVSGTPTTPGTSSVTVRVRSDDGQVATRSLTITVVEQLVVTTSSLPNGAPSVRYSHTLSAIGGDGSYAWSVISGSLPPNLNLSTAGTLSGTPNTPGTFGFTVRVRSGDGQNASRALSMTVNPDLVITTTSLPNGAPSVSYSRSLSATGGTGGYTWSLLSGSLPAGLSLSAAGTISGTPTTSGTSTFTARVRSGDGQNALSELSLVINPDLVITTSSLPNGAPSVRYRQGLSATGGDGSYTWSLRRGSSLPAGLTLDSGGLIGGTPTTPGTFGFAVQVSARDGQRASRSLSITINPDLVITTTALPNGAPGVGYRAFLSATGGTGGLTWSVSSGGLPNGLSLSSGGTVSGTPTTPGTFSFTVRARSGDGQSDTQALSIRINPDLVITTTSLPYALLDVDYSRTLSATGGAGGYEWSISSGYLPRGMFLSSTGTIFGPPPATGTWTFTVLVRSGDNQTDTQTLSLTISPNEAPTLSNFTHRWVSSTCGISGMARIEYTVSFSDPDGDNGRGITRVFVKVGSSAAYESSDYYNSYTGNGFNGTVTADNCLSGASWVQIWTLDGAGNTSNTVTRSIPSY
jgi:hypothetical protein